MRYEITSGGIRFIPEEQPDSNDLGEQVTCTCADWKNDARGIFAAQLFMTMRTGIRWIAGRWSFCPWCGAQLQEVKRD